MAERSYKERQALGRILLGISAFTGVMSIVYLIRFMFVREEYMGKMVASAFAATMLFGAFLAIGLNYTIRVPRGKDDDRSQVIAGIIMMILGTVICASMHIAMGVGTYAILPIVFYVQNWLMFLVALYSLKFYRKK